jgi:hypothetical protein
VRPVPCAEPRRLLHWSPWLWRCSTSPSAIFHCYILLPSVISLGVAVVAVWFILSRRGLARAVAGVVAAVALLTFIGVVLATESLIVLTVARARRGLDRCGQLRAEPGISRS